MKSIIWFFLLCGGLAQAGSPRLEWLHTMYGHITRHEITEKTPAIQLKELPEKDGFTYFPDQNNGVIRFENGETLLLISTSVHETNGVGDLTLIRTPDNKVYLSYGHVCATLIIESKQRVTDVKSFLATRGLISGNMDQLNGWHPIASAETFLKLEAQYRTARTEASEVR